MVEHKSSDPKSILERLRKAHPPGPNHASKFDCTICALIVELEQEAAGITPEVRPSKQRPFSLWSFLRDVLSQGATIQLDYRQGARQYEEFSARLDEAAREREAELQAQLSRGAQPDETTASQLAGSVANQSGPFNQCPVGWIVGEWDKNPAMYNLQEREKAFDAAKRWGRPITPVVLAAVEPKARQYICDCDPEQAKRCIDTDNRTGRPSNGCRRAEKAECALCAEGMNSFADTVTGNRMHARNGVVTVCTAQNGDGANSGN